MAEEKTIIQEGKIKMIGTEEGWGVKRPGDKVFHYYVDGTSLCRRIGFYHGPLDPDNGGSKQKSDCAECHRRLEKLRQK